MTVNPRTKAVELTPAEIKRAIAAHMKTKFNISCAPESISLRPVSEGSGIAAAEISKWDNTGDPEEDAVFRVSQ